MSSGESLSSTKTRQRERRAPLTRKEGFSVVEAMREIKPASTTGRSWSCCACEAKNVRNTHQPCDGGYH